MKESFVADFARFCYHSSMMIYDESLNESCHFSRLTHDLYSIMTCGSCTQTISNSFVSFAPTPPLLSARHRMSPAIGCVYCGHMCCTTRGSEVCGGSQCVQNSSINIASQCNQTHFERGNFWRKDVRSATTQLRWVARGRSCQHLARGVS